MRVIGIIPSRYASTRFPGKPLALIGGKTMIRRVYEQVSRSTLDAVAVATDDIRIADEVRSFGGRCVMTDPNHRSGTDRCREALDLVGGTYDAVVNIQGDEPFADPSQVDMLRELIARADTPIASLAKRIDTAEELLSPNAVKVVMSASGEALYFSRSPIPFVRNAEEGRWLQAATFYKHVGMYAYKADTLRRIAQLPQSPLERAESLEQLRWLENGFAIRMGITEAENVAVDTPSDLAKAEQYCRHNKL